MRKVSTRYCLEEINSIFGYDFKSIHDIPDDIYDSIREHFPFSYYLEPRKYLFYRSEEVERFTVMYKCRDITGYTLHHKARYNEYVCIGEYKIDKYIGRYGEGITVKYNDNYNKSSCCIEYYIKNSV